MEEANPIQDVDSIDEWREKQGGPTSNWLYQASFCEPYIMKGDGGKAYRVTVERVEDLE